MSKVLNRFLKPSMRHLVTMSDDMGIFEHAEGVVPRVDLGYCTDDNARLLIVTARDKGQTFSSRTLAHIGMDFLLQALRDDGRVHNRMSTHRHWTDMPSNDDCWGRAIWATGTAVSHITDTNLNDQGLTSFGVMAQQRGSSIRASSFAALGAAEVLAVHPDHDGAYRLMEDVIRWHENTAFDDAHWPWPEPRLTYANAVIPDALIAAAVATQNPKMLTRGLAMLAWLAQMETFNGRLSVTPTGGRERGDERPGFDQQPIEAAALADAFARAYRVTNNVHWRQRLKLAITWFLGHNDSGMLMIDPDSEGGYDGLEKYGVNLNQGAESTLAMISTMQHHRLCA